MPRGKFDSTNQKHYQDLGSDSDWSCHVENLIQPIRSTTQIWVVTCHQYRISTLVSQTSFGGETAGVASPNVGCFLRLLKTWRFKDTKPLYCELSIHLLIAFSFGSSAQVLINRWKELGKPLNRETWSVFSCENVFASNCVKSRNLVSSQWWFAFFAVFVCFHLQVSKGIALETLIHWKFSAHAPQI